MRHRSARAGLLVASLAVVAAAQDRPATGMSQDDRLAAYLRVGRYADATKLAHEMLATSSRSDLKNMLAVFDGGPNMLVRRAAASFDCEVTDTGVTMPLSVNGRPVQWLFDTAANVTIISDAEADRLGLVIRASEGRARDQAGGSTAVRAAVARRVVIGRTQIDHALFLVMPADQMPWKELPPGRQGILGLPMALALDALRWTRGGRCDTGSKAVSDVSAKKPTNLRYDNLHLITPVTYDGRSLDFILDTGNQAATQLWVRFGHEFAPLVKARGRQGSARITQVGGASDRDITIIPEVRLTVGGKETRLGEGQIFGTGVGDDRFHGLLGMDLLSQATEVTIDFRAMTLTLQ